MKAPAHLTELLRRSVIVTGTHYSTTTLVGAVLATAPEFRLLHEPLNPRPTASYDSLRPARWYEYYGEGRFSELQDGLARMLDRKNLPGAMLQRVLAARSVRELGQAARYVERKAPMLFAAKPVILKDPFLAFSARTLQQSLGTRIVVTIRHPGGFAESFLRKAGRFDFGDLASQEALMETMPADAEAIARFASEEQPAIAQAGLLWRVVYGFAELYLLPHPRSILLRQEDLVERTDQAVDTLFAFAQASRTRATDRFLARSMGAGAADHGGASYIHRDGKAAASKWRGRLSPQDVAVLRKNTGELAGRLGYPSDDWPY